MEPLRPTRTLLPLRSYTVVLLALGVLVLLCVVGFVLLAAHRVSAIGREEAVGQSALESARLGRLVDVAFRLSAARSGAPDDHMNEVSWEKATVDLEESLSIDPLLTSVEVHGAGFQRPVMIPIRTGEDETPIRSTQVRYPPGAFEATSVIVLGRYLGDPIQLSRDRLMSFLTAGTIVLSIVLYVLVALILLVSRAQAEVEKRARERAARLRTVGDVAGGLAHEVRNPLNAVGLHLQYLEKVQEKLQRAPSGDDYRRLHGELAKLRTVVDHFVAFAKTKDPVPQALDLRALWSEVKQEFAAEIARLSDGFSEHLHGEEFHVEADRDKIRDVVRAALRQCMEAAATKPDPHVAVSLWARPKDVRLVFEDSGPTADHAALARLFQPTFAAHESLAPLAMTLAKIVVESHGGRISGTASTLGGTRLQIELPRRVLGSLAPPFDGSRSS